MHFWLLTTTLAADLLSFWTIRHVLSNFAGNKDSSIWHFLFKKSINESRDDIWFVGVFSYSLFVMWFPFVLVRWIIKSSHMFVGFFNAFGVCTCFLMPSKVFLRPINDSLFDWGKSKIVLMWFLAIVRSLLYHALCKSQVASLLSEYISKESSVSLASPCKDDFK